MSTLAHSFPRCLQEYRHVISKSILDKNQNAGEICSLQPCLCSSCSQFPSLTRLSTSSLGLQGQLTQQGWAAFYSAPFQWSSPPSPLSHFEL